MSCCLYRLQSRADDRMQAGLLRPLLDADRPPATSPLRNALRTIDIHMTETIHQAYPLPNQLEDSRHVYVVATKGS